MTQAHAPLIGRVVSNYRLTRVLGEGGFATVYLGEHLVLHTRRAVKVLHQKFLDNPDIVSRFIGEARSLAAVRHPNVVEVYDLRVTPGESLYMVMEYLPGENLAAAIEHSALPVLQAAPFILQICAALDAAHAAGVIHRDLKPDNVHLMRGPGRIQVKLVDFGIARRERLKAGEVRTAQGMVLGTPGYMSPEQITGAPVDGRSDVYALGVLLFRIATGRAPFEQRNMMDLLTAHIGLPPPAPRTIDPFISEALQAIILKALAKTPAERFSSAGDLARALAACVAAENAGLDADAMLAAAGILEPARGGRLVAALGRLDRAPDLDNYALLGVPPNASADELRTRFGELAAELAALAATPGDPAQLTALKARLAAAEEVLLDPAWRAAHDARLGNFEGIGRCIEAGLMPDQLDVLRAHFIARGGEPVDANTIAPTSDALAAALRRDPLNLELHERYWAISARV